MAINVRWGEYTSRELAEFAAKDAVVVLPIGSMEQHGPHMTVDTDSVLAEHVALAGAQGVADRVPVLVTPILWTGFSPHHLHFAGSISLRLSTLQSVLEDVVDSLLKHGFGKILFLNGHGGNIAPLKSILYDLGSRREGHFGFASYWDLVGPEAKELFEESGSLYPGHAGEFEASLQLALHAERVRPLAEDHGYSERRPKFQLDNRAYVYQGFHEFNAQGFIGDATKANPEKGKAFLQLVVDGLGHLIEEIYQLV